MPELVAPPIQSLDENCDRCGQRYPQSRKESMSKIKVEILMSAGQLVAGTMHNRFKLKQIAACNIPSKYNTFQKLRYHGLVAKAVVDGQPVVNEWVITRNGFRFLRGQIEIPKFVLVKQNHITERSPKLVSITDVWRDAPYLETSFEYFDDFGNAVGIRPNQHNDQQRLI